MFCFITDAVNAILGWQRMAVEGMVVGWEKYRRESVTVKGKYFDSK